MAGTFGLFALVVSIAALPSAPAATRAAAGLSFVALAPDVVLVQYTSQNAVAVYPPLCAGGPSRPGGFDAVGHRLILSAMPSLCPRDPGAVN